jgi:hypothetical protein
LAHLSNGRERRRANPPPAVAGLILKPNLSRRFTIKPLNLRSGECA